MAKQKGESDSFRTPILRVSIKIVQSIKNVFFFFSGETGSRSVTNEGSRLTRPCNQKNELCFKESTSDNGTQYSVNTTGYTSTAHPRPTALSRSIPCLRRARYLVLRNPFSPVFEIFANIIRANQQIVYGDSGQPLRSTVTVEKPLNRLASTFRIIRGNDPSPALRSNRFDFRTSTPV